MRKSFKTSFNYGQEVTLKTEPTGKYIVSAFLLRKGLVQIGVMNEDTESWHLEDDLQPYKKPFIVKGFR